LLRGEIARRFVMLPDRFYLLGKTGHPRNWPRDQKPIQPAQQLLQTLFGTQRAIPQFHHGRGLTGYFLFQPGNPVRHPGLDVLRENLQPLPPCVVRFRSQFYFGVGHARANTLFKPDLQLTAKLRGDLT
jgi:hypothetical protein